MRYEISEIRMTTNSKNELQMGKLWHIIGCSWVFSTTKCKKSLKWPVLIKHCSSSHRCRKSEQDDKLVMRRAQAMKLCKDTNTETHFSLQYNTQDVSNSFSPKYDSAQARPIQKKFGPQFQNVFQNGNEPKFNQMGVICIFWWENFPTVTTLHRKVHQKYW